MLKATLELLCRLPHTLQHQNTRVSSTGFLLGASLPTHTHTNQYVEIDGNFQPATAAISLSTKLLTSPLRVKCIFMCVCVSSTNVWVTSINWSKMHVTVMCLQLNSKWTVQYAWAICHLSLFCVRLLLSPSHVYPLLLACLSLSVSLLCVCLCLKVCVIVSQYVWDPVTHWPCFLLGHSAAVWSPTAEKLQSEHSLTPSPHHSTQTHTARCFGCVFYTWRARNSRLKHFIHFLCACVCVPVAAFVYAWVPSLFVSAH